MTLEMTARWVNYSALGPGLKGGMPLRRLIQHRLSIKTIVFTLHLSMKVGNETVFSRPAVAFTSSCEMEASATLPAIRRRWKQGPALDHWPNGSRVGPVSFSSGMKSGSSMVETSGPGGPLSLSKGVNSEISRLSFSGSGGPVSSLPGGCSG